MGYKQHNNPFGKIISPLKHSVTDRSGNPWEHQHDGRNVTGQRQFREIKGQSTFGQRGDKKIRGGRSEKEIAMEYANQLADYYNQGAIAGGNFKADDYDKIKNFKRSKKQRGFFGRLTGVDIFRDQHGRVVVDRGRKNKGVSGTRQYNVKQGEWDSEKGAYKNIPAEQMTGDQIYEMMVEGGGVVSIVDGKFVAGNPNKDYVMQDYKGEGYNAVPRGYTVVENDERSGGDPLSIQEILRLRREKNNPINMMKNSPLNTGHGLDTDERSNNEQEGYDYVYRPEDNVTTTERVELDDGGYKIITRVVTPGTGTQIIEEPGDSGGDGGGSSSGRDFYNPELPNQSWDEWVEAPCPSPGKNRQPGDKYCPPKTDEVEIVNVSEEIFPPDPVEEPDVIPPPSLDLGVPGSSKSSGGSFRFHIPDIDLMGGVRAVIDGVVFTNKGRCKSGCATNKNS